MHGSLYVPLYVTAAMMLLLAAEKKEAIFEPGARLKAESAAGSGGEGPAWHPRLGVLTSGNGHIMQLDRDGKSRIYRKNAGTNGLLFDKEGHLLACDSVRRRVTRTERDGKVVVLADKFGGKPFNEPNDLTLDSKGRTYFSDPRYGNTAGKDQLDEKNRTIEGVYRIDPDGQVTRVLGREVERANGVLVSVGDKYLYVADNRNDAVDGARKLWRFDLKDDGTVDTASKKLLFDWDKGRGPDGIKQDQKGRLYVAAGRNKPTRFEPAKDRKGGVYVLSPEGELLAFLPVPTDEVTNCAFGGDDLKTLYITAGGTLYSIRTTTPGRVMFPAASGAAETPESLCKTASAVLAQLEGEIKVPGLKEPVEILRDRWGIAHIYAKNADDLFFAQGFVAAQDRLFQIDLWRRVGVGETAEIVGKSGLEADRFARLLKYRGDPEAEWASYAPDARRIATAFTHGINAYIDHIGDRLPIEFQLLGVRPKKWQPEDCLGRMSGIIMTRNFRIELARAELVAAVGIEKARRIAPTDPPRAYAPAPGLDLAGINCSILAGYNVATKTPTFQLGGDGSNNWAVDGTLSASGKPLLASDPHRTIALPSLRYLVHLHAPGWNVIGSGEPGLPGVAIGHNEHVAWGFTIVGTDQSDIYVEETNPSNSAEYRVGDRWEKITVVRETVAVRGAEQPAELELRFTRHGPVIVEDAKRHRAYVLKWAGSEPGGAAYLASLAVDRVKNGREFVAALKRWKLPCENMVYADVEGNIGWVAAALTPVRKGWDGLLPVPGAKGIYEWQGFLPLKELPQVHNPAVHYVATANHNILPPDFKTEISYEWAPPYRFARIHERLEEKKKFTLEDFRSMQHDVTTLPGRTLARLVKVAGMNDRELQPYVEVLAGWDGVLSADSHAGALYGVWLQELLNGFYRPRVPAGLLDFTASRSGVPVMLAALEKPDEAWFGKKPIEARDQLLRTTFRKAVDRLRKLLPGDDKEWSWGRLHTTTFRHPLATLGSVYAKTFDLGPVPRAGDAHTPNAASHNEKFAHISGATYRHVLDLADWDRGLATSAPGQSGQLGSPHYSDLLPLWEKGEYFPLAFTRAKVENLTRHRLKLTPAGR